MGWRRLVPVGMLASVALLAPTTATGAQPERLTLMYASGGTLGGPYQRWVDRAFVPTVGGRLRVFLSGCPRRPRMLGCVNTRRLRTVYLRRGGSGMRAVLFHELGHLFDLRVLGASERRVFKRIFGLGRRSWFRGSAPPAEWFAEAYSLCARRRRLGKVARGSYGLVTGPRRHAASCNLIRRAAGPAEPPTPPPNPPLVTGPVAVEPPTADPPPPPERPSLLDLLFRH